MPQTTGWRTIVAGGHEQLALQDAHLILRTGEEEQRFALDQIRNVIITYPKGSISIALMKQMAEQHIGLIICDEKRTPACELASYGQHNDAAGCVMDQAAWVQSDKDAVWAEIVKNKLNMQAELLRLLGKQVPIQLSEYIAAVEPGDPSNREGLGARLYFQALFGNDFRRHDGGSINAALNYGYAMISSAMSRILSLHGYNLSLGVHHCSRDDRINLTCDLMEPFRPVADRIVYGMNGAALDWTHKKELIAVTETAIRYDDRTMKLTDAMECFALDVLRKLKYPHHELGGIAFE